MTQNMWNAKSFYILPGFYALPKRVRRCTVKVKKPIPKLQFPGQFHCVFSCSCHQHSTCLWFVLVQQIHNSQPSMLHICVNFSCILCARKWWVLPQRQLLLGFWILPIHPCRTPIIIFKKEILGLTPVSLAGPSMCQHNFPSYPNLADRAQIW